MGDTRRREPRQQNSSNQQMKGDLKSNPFKDALRDVRIPGPSCVHCRKEIDTRIGRSLSNQRGARASVRNGYIHPECEAEASAKYFKAEWKQSAGKYLQFVLVNERLEVPVFTDAELDELIDA